MALCSTSKNLGSVFFCIPLALFGLLTGIAFVLWGSWEINNTVKNPDFPQWQLVTGVILSAIKVLMGIMAITGSLFRWIPGASCLIQGYKILLISVVLSFVVSWIEWIIKISQSKNDSTPSNEKFPQKPQITFMILFTAAHIVFFILSWWILSCYKSLVEILKVGGTGWELKNYRAIKTERTLHKAALKAEEEMA